MARVEGVKSAPAYTGDAKAKEIVAVAHTKKGSSGGPMFDTAGNLRALVTHGPRDGRPEDDVTVLRTRDCPRSTSMDGRGPKSEIGFAIAAFNASSPLGHKATFMMRSQNAHSVCITLANSQR